MRVKKRGKTNNPVSTGKKYVVIDGRDFHSGEDGIVWATYELRQSEIIQSTLLVHDIHSVLNRYPYNERELILIQVTNPKDVNKAIDFIWRSESGLRLKSDWSYPAGHVNKSVEYWLGGK